MLSRSKCTSAIETSIPDSAEVAWSNRGKSRRAHDLIDLQLIVRSADVDLVKTRIACERLFKYRKCQMWPPKVVKMDGWSEIYDAQKLSLTVLPTVDDAITWANELIAKIESAKCTN